MAGLAQRDFFGPGADALPGGALHLGLDDSGLGLEDTLSGLDTFLHGQFHAGDLLQLSAEEDQLLRTLGHDPSGGVPDALLFDDKRGVPQAKRTPLTRVAFSTGDLESLAYGHGGPGMGHAYGHEQKYGGPSFQRLGGLEPSLLFDGPGTFSVAEGDESGAEYELGNAAMGGAGMFAPQRPGVPSQRAAPTRQRTPTVRHAPAALGGAGGRRLAPPGVQTYVAPTAAKSANASSAALMPPPPPRASARAAAAVAPPAAAAGPAALSRSPEAQARTSSGRRTTSTNVTARPMLRRVQSTGDLHAYNAQASLRSPLHAVMEGGLSLGTQDDGVYRIGKYTLEERRMRILRYRQKRHERNFERKIKYSCRKVLADSRPRVRGRFAKNEDNAAPKLDPDDFDFMDDGLLEDEHSGDQPAGVFEHTSGASTTGRSGGEERQSALASVFAV